MSIAKKVVYIALAMTLALNILSPLSVLATNARIRHPFVSICTLSEWWSVEPLWTGDNTVTITFRETSLTMTIGSTIAYVDNPGSGRRTIYDIATYIGVAEAGMLTPLRFDVGTSPMYVPLEFVADIFDFEFRISGGHLVTADTYIVGIGMRQFSVRLITPSWSSINTGFTTEPMVATGGSHSLALASDGLVWAWGCNRDGAIGDGRDSVLDTGQIRSYQSSHTSPVQVQNLTNVVAVAAGPRHSLALRYDGTVWEWGYRALNRLVYLRETHTLPEQVLGIRDVIAISAGNSYSAALMADGTVWTWARPRTQAYRSMMMRGNETFSRVPMQKQGIGDVVAISVGDSHILALRADGTVWTWEGSRTPGQVQGLSSVVSISAGSMHHLALLSDGTVRIWAQQNDPVIRTIPNLSDVVSIEASGTTDGQERSTFLRSNGTVWVYSDNTLSQQMRSHNIRMEICRNLSDNEQGHAPLSATLHDLSNLGNVAAIATGAWLPMVGLGTVSPMTHSIVIKTDGTVWNWGENYRGQLGIGINGGCWGSHNCPGCGSRIRNSRSLLFHPPAPVQVLAPDGIGFLNLGVISAPMRPLALPQATTSRTLRFAIGNTTFINNGMPEILEAAPFIADGRTMVPLRVIAEGLGATNLDMTNNVVSFYIGGQHFSMIIGQELPGRFGTPVIVEGRTFVPLGFIANQLEGATARWDGSTGQGVAYVYIQN